MRCQVTSDICISGIRVSDLRSCLANAVSVAFLHMTVIQVAEGQSVRCQMADEGRDGLQRTGGSTFCRQAIGVRSHYRRFDMSGGFGKFLEGGRKVPMLLDDWALPEQSIVHIQPSSDMCSLLLASEMGCIRATPHKHCGLRRCIACRTAATPPLPPKRGSWVRIPCCMGWSAGK